MSTEQVFADQSTYLSILTAADGAAVKDFVEPLLARLSAVQVLASRTGLAMLPFTDSVKGITFYLGETLLAEAHVRVGAQEGYAACLGRDLEQAIALTPSCRVMRLPWLPNNRPFWPLWPPLLNNKRKKRPRCCGKWPPPVLNWRPSDECCDFSKDPSPPVECG